MLFLLAIDFLQRPNPESESRHDSFVGEPLPMLQSLARGYRRGTTDLKLADLVPAAVDAFYADQIGVGHALLLAKLPADQQEAALQGCFKEVYNGGSKPARILLPVRNLQFWIDSNIRVHYLSGN